MKTIDEPPYLTVGTDVSAKYRGAFCEAKIKTAKRLVKVKVTFKQDLSTGEVQDDHIKGPLKVGAVVEVKTQDGAFQEAIINKLTDASWYTVVFDDGDEKTMRRSSLCLKGERHFAESETLDQLPLTNPEHFGTPVIGKKSNRGRRSNHVPEEESSSSSSEEDEGGRRLNDELLGKVVCVEYTSADKKKASWYPALVISPDCNDEVAVKKDNILVRSFKDGKFNVVLRKDVREINSEMAPKPEAGMKPALDRALEFLKSRVVPSNWRTELKEESSSSEEEDDQEEEEDTSSEDDEEEVEPFPGERENFLQQLYKFMEDRGTPINKRPVLGYRNLNLFKLYRLVHRLGGFDNIDSGSVWKQVYQDLGIPVLNSAAGYNVKCAYRKYLYGFEEYCKSTGIMFQMALPEKSASIPETRRGEEEESLFHKPELTAEKPKLKKEEQEEKTASPEMACKKETETKPSKREKKTEVESTAVKDDNYLEIHSLKNEDEEEEVEDNDNEEEDEREAPGDNSVNLLKENMKQDQPEEKDISGDESIKEGEGEEEEEFECYPPGMKVQVRYGRGKTQKLYEASVKDSDLEGGEVLYLVHYCGWNVRYDEWIKADKIVRPADKNVPKIKHRKKIKNKMEKEKDKMERAERDEVSPPKINHIGRSAKSPLNSTPSDSYSKLDSGEAKGAEQTAVKSIEITSILNGLQASESSAEESECEDGDDEDEYEEEQESQGKEEKIGSLESMHVLERWQVGLSLDERRPAMVEEQEEPEHLSDTQDSVMNTRAEQEGEAESEKEEELKRKLEIKQEERATERPSKSQLKRKRRNSRMEEWLRTGSHEQVEDRAKPVSLGFTGSSSSEDEDEQKQHQQQEEEEEQERTKTKNTLSKKYNGLEEKRKCGRPAGFWDVPEKRPKLLGGSEERLPNSRAKGQKDVWSSIQGQWPKKTLKELFSDSDTEAANSPPPVPPPEDPRQEPAPEEITEKERIEGKLSNEEREEKRAEFPSSGSNSVLNTPPTTPESPSLSGSRMKPNRTPPAAPPPPAANPLPPPPAPSPTAHHPVQEENVGGRSETDSSTVEVESLGGELQEIRSEGGGSPMVFDSSLSSNSNSSSSILINNSNSSLPETEHMEKVTTSQKRHKDAHRGASSKKQKRSHKNSDVHPKKSRKTAHSSDSEDQSASENAAKSLATKSAASLKPASQPKRLGRTHSPGKFSKHGDSEQKEPNNRSSRVYKWSFQMSDLEKMTSVERVAFLQEKLQDIRSHYISLKSEVASIDRRRKRLKKKERESAAAASSSSSSSSSPSSSSITAAVMLTLSEQSVSGSSQNSGSVSVECR
ncbi:AT-rich interactive domain-containing protein 4B isoform X1 [Acipenser ruthenus]|uniref:AT-rich interactive domain-containing protein 4B isoform X1 n=1 Tax=Acipenser ruthenus TaxID=7906 RepID=UPI0027429C13|nr:AT-rich interactive domain-containing protein 4B isoform X1 [Acipenser ruthenus]XP_058881423.1 AT-rich interactive domain-containing protein 4B isoform X1 [Acipenser ruthenus]XP_058881424.1 AT-rich interactive domain-containing protein 4B isoform X1 [Acipenser ruthenus]